MSQTTTSTSGLVRVTVASQTRRVDLVLPASVPVAELLPELARSVGLLDSATAYGGYRLVTSEGRTLAADSGLTMQGIEDGSVITVAAGIDDDAPAVYDDVVEAMTDVVERELKPWEAASGRRTALAAATMLMGLAGLSLLVQRDSDLATAAAGAISLALVVGAIVLSRAQREREAAVTVGWIAAGYAGITGYLLAPDGNLFGTGLAYIGAGIGAVGVVCLVGLGAGRVLLVPALVSGAVLGVAGLLNEGGQVDLDVLLVCVTTFVVVLGSVFPWLALGITSTNVDQLYTPADITADPDVVDRSRVSDDARTAHEILIAISSTVGILIVFSVPFAVGTGLPGVILAVVWCLVVMLRTRQYRTGSEVLVGLVSGIAGLAVLGLSLLVLRDDWRPTVAVALAVSGAVLLVLTLLPSSPSLRRGRAGDVVETLSLVALLPLLVLASGLFATITDR